MTGAEISGDPRDVSLDGLGDPVPEMGLLTDTGYLRTILAECCMLLSLHVQRIVREPTSRKARVEMCWDNPRIGDEAWACSGHGVWHF